ncbi:MAG: hypothetical protein CL828_07415 [Crocinitomicaceae bacterium]|nr:hypothetical protein [Crocinitomicaceae bacterium]
MNSEQPLPWSSLLKQFWGYDSLRQHQFGPIEAICAGKDAIAVLPTGGGKSLCYQLPGLVRGGTTLVISPLIALMEDQLKDLKSRGIHAFSLAGVSSRRELERVLDNAERCQPSFLFTSPEKLERPVVQVRLNRLGINTVAVDEAHCISEWGHDFRPAYRHIAAVRSEIPKAVWGCFTATATERVITDIQENLKLSHPAVYRSSTRRDNLNYSVCSVRDSEAMLYQAVLNSSGAGLVYVGTRYKAEKWAKRLEGIQGGVESYHAGLDAQTRAYRLEGWIRGEIRVIVCTNAFGMGIDKSDVRWVFHACIPANLESYVQEAGRAGRDGFTSECALFVRPEMLDQRLQQLKQFDPNELPINETYQFIANQGEVTVGTRPDISTPFNAAAFTSSQGYKTQTINRSIQLLQRAGYFGKVTSVGEICLQFSFNERSQTELHEIAQMPTEEGAVARHLATFAACATIRRKQSEFSGIGLDWNRVLFALRRLEEWGVLAFAEHQHLQQIEWTQPRTASKVLIPPEVGIEPYERSLERLGALGEFVETNICRQLFIAQYFGFPDTEPCGQCDNCLEVATDATSDFSLNRIPEEGVDFTNFIKGIPPSRYNICIQTLKSAEENGHIRFEKMRIYKAG